MIRQQALNKNLQVSFQIDPVIKTIQTDPRRFKQMLVNLLGNAVKFTPSGGQVGLDVRADYAAGTVRLTVWDTGIGVKPEDAQRLFQPFSQVDSGLTRQYGGTGLGLSLVYRMAELHGGGVSLDSIPGQGSRFTISLPWTGESDRPGTSPLKPLRAPDIHRALVIEDSPPLAEKLVRYLQDLGAQTTQTPEGEEGFRLALELRPDVILLDTRLADLPSWETLACLKKDPHVLNIPVIIISEVDELARGQDLGAADYIIKPVTRQRLHESLVKVLGAQEPAAAAALPSRRPLILIAEDNLANQTTYADYLAAKGYRVVAASTGQETIARVREAMPDLILLDVQLPEIDGLEIARRLRNDPQYSAIPIVAITALAMPGDRQRCLAAGMNDYLTKPVSLKHLAQTIETYTQTQTP
jgi:CheY-like chemotaxis protein